MDISVVDASALAAVLFAEPGGQRVASRLGGHILAAPDLLAYEIANVCLNKIKRNQDQDATILDQFQLWKKLGVKLYPMDTAPLVTLARDFNLTVYDASYVHLSLRLDAELVSLDTDLLDAWRSILR